MVHNGIEYGLMAAYAEGLNILGHATVGNHTRAVDDRRRDRGGGPAPVLSAALYQRFSSRGETEYADKLLSALRYQFGGHEETVA